MVEYIHVNKRSTLKLSHGKRKTYIANKVVKCLVYGIDIIYVNQKYDSTVSIPIVRRIIYVQMICVSDSVEWFDDSHCSIFGAQMRDSRR